MNDITQALVQAMQELNFTEMTIKVILDLIPIALSVSPLLALSIIKNIILKHSSGF